MAEHYPILTILVPFLSAFVISVTGLFNRRLCHPLSVAAAAGGVWMSVETLTRVLAADGRVLSYRLGGWTPPMGIEYRVDALNALVLVLITVVTLLVAVFAKESVSKEMGGKEHMFYPLFLLLEVGCLGITITGDAFNLYVFLEISSLTSYALIAMGRGRAALSCFNYIIMGTIGASFILLGVGYLYIQTGSLNMTDIHRILTETGAYASSTVRIGFLLILIGVWIKMAFFPLHRWLPNAYTFAPSATSALVAPLMTKVSVYVMIRFIVTVFSPAFAFVSITRNNAVVWLAVAAMLVGSFFALAKNKLKKMLAYLIVAEVGYMVGGVWLANETGMTGAIFHILSDGMMTLCLFLFAGIMFHTHQNYNISSLKGMYAKMPFTMAGFTVGALSMIGIPPTCGFFSKWYLISGGIEAGHWGFVAGLLISSMVNAILFFKIIERAHFGGDGHGPVKIQEAPLTMVIPLLVTAASLILLGVFSSDVIAIISRFVAGVGMV